MRLYEYMDSIDPRIPMLSEKYEFDAFGYNYTEHYCYENWRILENMHTGKCIKIYCSETPQYEEFNSESSIIRDIGEMNNIITVLVSPSTENKLELFIAENVGITKLRKLALAPKLMQQFKDYLAPPPIGKRLMFNTELTKRKSNFIAILKMIIQETLL